MKTGTFIGLAAAALSFAIFATGGAYAQKAPPRKPPVVIKKTPNNPDRPVVFTEPPWTVCFYSGVNFTDNSFCLEKDQRMPRVDDHWKVRIKSIEVVGVHGPSVKICNEVNMTGDCMYVGFRRARLPDGFFDHVYSYHVH